MNTPNPLNPPMVETTLEQSNQMIRPLIRWLLRSGVGYMDFALNLKQTFLEESLHEIECLEAKQTVSAISIMSGLHRKDVATMLQEKEAGKTIKSSHQVISLSSQIITQWLIQNLPHTLPLNEKSNEPSFEKLCKTTSKDVHPATVVAELKRLKMVKEEQGSITLLKDAYTPDTSTIEAHQLLVESISDHIRAGANNLSPNKLKTHLEQSVFADGLSAASVRELEQLSNELWMNALETIAKKATQLCEQDATLAETFRFKLGMFSYSDVNPFESLNSNPNNTQTAVKQQEVVSLSPNHFAYIPQDKLNDD